MLSTDMQVQTVRSSFAGCSPAQNTSIFYSQGLPSPPAQIISCILRNSTETRIWKQNTKVLMLTTPSEEPTLHHDLEYAIREVHIRHPLPSQACDLMGYGGNRTLAGNRGASPLFSPITPNLFVSFSRTCIHRHHVRWPPVAIPEQSTIHVFSMHINPKPVLVRELRV